MPFMKIKASRRRVTRTRQSGRLIPSRPLTRPAVESMSGARKSIDGAATESYSQTVSDITYPIRIIDTLIVILKTLFEERQHRR